MKKVGLTLLLLLVAGFLGLGFYFDALVKKSIEVVGERVLGTQVTLSSVKLSPFSGRGELEGLRIKNPDQFNSDYAIEIAKLEVELSVGSIFSDTLEIFLINIENPEITYELGLGGTNIGTLLDKLSSDSNQSAQGSEKKIIIREFRMSEPRVKLAASVATVPVILPDINIDGIGIEEGGITVANAGKQIFGFLNRSLATLSLKDINVIKEGIEKKVEQIKGLLDKIF